MSSDPLDAGQRAFDRGDLEPALASFEAALRVDPRDARAWFGKGLVLETRGEHAAARDAYQRGLDIRPDDALAWFNHGITLVNEHALISTAPSASAESYEEARRSLARAAALGNEQARAVLQLVVSFASLPRR